MAVPEGFVPAVSLYVDTIGAAGLAEIKAEFLNLFARINAGESGAIVTASIGGQNAMLNGAMTVEEKFIAYGQVIREQNGTAVPMTFASFAGLAR